ncbi:hypothetical protein [Mycolicibacterium palauense]|uniref:hypothetical protein n=1 Tax=Mycolicibacterium palauense TaxID=2034511 RepID=UPI000BFEEE42|nr:hypothetical protein [Mycolicibacterium palauense]
MAQSLITHTGVSVSMLKERIADLTHELEVAQEEYENAQPVEPQSIGSVIRFTNWNGYLYAAIKLDKGWYVTQDGSRSARQGIKPMTWEKLLEWVGVRNWEDMEVLS